MSDVKFVDLAMSQLESHGIELTEDQKENAKRSIGLEVQEGFASFVPMIAELAVANKATGAVKLASGFKRYWMDGGQAVSLREGLL
jgi:DNA helicase TIP49 (TBP-interacting protein)